MDVDSNHVVQDEDIIDTLKKEYEELRKLNEDQVRNLDFESHDKALAWYKKFGCAWGFSVRLDDRELDANGVIKSRTIVCSKEGRRRAPKVPRKNEARPETRCNCPAYLNLKLDYGTSKFRVAGFSNSHNHEFTEERLIHYLRQNRDVGEAGRAALRQSIATGLRPSAAFNVEIAKFGGHPNLGYTRLDALNQCAMDKTDRISKGINHHNKTCIFGCAFMQHEKEDNYKWVLDTLTTGGGKKPQTVITDRDRAMANAIDYVFPEATHRLCSWHLNNNVIKHVKNHKFRKG
ncbi:Protein FAR1-RELATED SEQUENCE 5 [Linum grandiflorum]